jgi:hypothetical protein
MSLVNSSLCIFEPLKTKLRYEPRLQNVSNTVNNWYKGNHLTMKNSTIFTGGRRLNNTKIKNSELKKTFGSHFSPLFKENKPPS